MRVLMFGAGGHAKVVEKCMMPYYVEAYFVDEPNGLFYGGHPMHKTEDLAEFLKGNPYEKRTAFVAIGDNHARERMFNIAKTNGLELSTFRHALAYDMTGGDIGRGTVVMPGAVIEPGAKIGKGCILNTGCSIGHDTKVSDFTHIAPGARIGGGCWIGDHVLIGINSAVNAHLSVGDNQIVPSGKAVIVDMPARKAKQ